MARRDFGFRDRSHNHRITSVMHRSPACMRFKMEDPSPGLGDHYRYRTEGLNLILMQRPSAILILTVAVTFYWTLPVRAFSFTPRFDHAVVMAKPDGPHDEWFVPPQPIQLCINEKRSGVVADVATDSAHPAWVSFAVVASWSLMIIADRSERTALDTLALMHYATPVMFAVTAIFASIALDNDSDLLDNESVDNDSD